MHCLVLGAGYATRLYPLTRDRPKPLLPVGGTPIIARILEQVLSIDGLEQVSVVSNHRFITHYQSWLQDYERKTPPPCPIKVVDDQTQSADDRLGAIGDMQFVIDDQKVEGDFMVVAGDNLFEFPMQPFVDFAREKGSAVGLKDLGSKKLVSLYGAVELDELGKVVDFEEKPPQPQTTLISIGVYYFGKQHVPLIGQYLRSGRNQDRPGDYIAWLHRQINLYGYVIEGEWYDIGDIDSYNDANRKYLDA